MDLPAGFKRFEVEGAVLVLREGPAAALLRAGVHDPEGLLARSPSSLAGRAPLARVELGDGGHALVRCLHRGGLLGKLVRRLWLDRLSLDGGRALAELLVSARAAARGARVLEVLGAVTRRSGLGWRHGLITREVAGARDLLALLRGSPSGSARRAGIAAAGRAVARLHAAGVDHVDLNLKNVLLGPDGEALVIDLDRCRIGEGPAPWPVVRENLLRLYRSWWKLRAAEPGSVHPRDPLRFLRAYAGPDRELRRRLRAAGRARTWPLRGLLWRLRPPRLA